MLSDASAMRALANPLSPRLCGRDDGRRDGGQIRADYCSVARRQLAEHLPESVAFAGYEFIIGLRLDNPQRVGKQLRPPIEDRHIARHAPTA